MNDFGKDFEFITENENENEILENVDMSENAEFEDIEKIEDAPQVVLENKVWGKDDFERSLVKTTFEKDNKKKKFFSSNTKKYVAVVTISAVLNIAILCGIFAAGYALGGRRGSLTGKNAIVESMNNEKNTSGATHTIENGAELSTVEISKKVGPSVVGITSQMQSAMSIFGTATVSEGSGSGIIITGDGYIVTNNHVIDGATKVTVTLNTGSEYEAKIVGKDAKTDLAVIKISPDENLTVAELGDSTKLEVGEKAVAIGNPLGMEFFGSTTQGIISAVNRTITVENRTMNVIQTDAAINSGNSGGALVNSYGKVIGINAVKISSSMVEGMGFAIPISEAMPIISDLMQHGYVKGRPVIGISSRDVTEYMSQRQGWPTGVQVMSVLEGSGADVAGLEQGDIIIKADGKAVKNVDELNKIKDSHKPGEFIQMEVFKYSTGLNQKVSVKLTEERP